VLQALESEHQGLSLNQLPERTSLPRSSTIIAQTEEFDV